MIAVFTDKVSKCRPADGGPQASSTPLLFPCTLLHSTCSQFLHTVIMWLYRLARGSPWSKQSHCLAIAVRS